MLSQVHSIVNDRSDKVPQLPKFRLLRIIRAIFLFYEVAVDTLDKIKEQINSNSIILYMKGSPNIPQCGFSARAVQCIESCNVDFAYVDILSNPEIRQTLPLYANWPTFPQLYVKGELIGGSDIIMELYEQGELAPLLQEAVQAS